MTKEANVIELKRRSPSEMQAYLDGQKSMLKLIREHHTNLEAHIKAVEHFHQRLGSQNESK